MKIFMLAMSLRQGSYNKKLIRLAAKHLQNFPICEVELSEFNDFPIPLYNGDDEHFQGIPASVVNLGAKINEADAVIISSPEYNGSIPGTFKNAIDWLSRLNPIPLYQKQILLIGASPGSFGAVRGNIHSRVPLHILGAYVYPGYYGLAKADTAFTEDDELIDPLQTNKLKQIIADFIRYAARKETPFEELGDFMEKMVNHPPPH